MSRHLYIGGYGSAYDRWKDYERDSLQIEAVLTYQIDTAGFRIRGTKPTEGQEVIIKDTDPLLYDDGHFYDTGLYYLESEPSSYKKFAGIISKVTLAWTSSDKRINVWQVECDDYTPMLDRRLVVEVYENYTADEIISDIITKYCSGFTVVNVMTGSPLIETTGADFNYKPPSECFKWLCDYTGWQWYVDYSKDIHFFDPSILLETAPMTLTTGGRFRNLKHSIDQQGLRNRVYVRGGTMLSDFQTIEWKADGVARSWVLPFGPHDVTFSVGGVAKTVGIENVDEEASYDYMLNFQEKYIRCSTGTSAPADGTTMSLVAKQDIDVITYSEDTASQAALAAVQSGDGTYEHVIVDDSIVTLEAAVAMADADLREHADPRVKGSFETETGGWATGQLVTINLTDRGINNTYVVQKVTTTTATPTIWTYKIEYAGRLLGVADFLKALVSAQQKKKLGSTEIIHKVKIFTEDTVDLTDTLATTPRTPPWICGEADAICGFVECSS